MGEGEEDGGDCGAGLERGVGDVILILLDRGDGLYGLGVMLGVYYTEYGVHMYMEMSWELLSWLWSVGAARFEEAYTEYGL